MAAAVVTLVSVSKNHLRYTLTGGIGETVNLDATHASIATTLPTGPLKDILTATYGNQAAARAAMRGSQIRIHFQHQVGGADCLVDVNGGAPSQLRLTLTTRVSAASQSVLDIEYRHSLGR